MSEVRRPISAPRPVAPAGSPDPRAPMNHTGWQRAVLADGVLAVLADAVLGDTVLADDTLLVDDTVLADAALADGVLADTAVTRAAVAADAVAADGATAPQAATAAAATATHQLRLIPLEPTGSPLSRPDPQILPHQPTREWSAGITRTGSDANPAVEAGAPAVARASRLAACGRCCAHSSGRVPS